LTNNVPRELLVQNLEAADWAPSANNAQPWKFIVLKDSDLKLKLSLAMPTSWTADLA
jgi:nitroreductase